MELGQTENTQSINPTGEAIEFGFIVTKLISDMKFVAWITIIEGAITCISIIGAIIGIPVLISGLRLKEAAEELAIYKNSNDFTYLKRALDKQQRFFFIQKILMIVGIVFGILSIIILIAAFAAGFNALKNQSDFEAYSSILRAIF